MMFNKLLWTIAFVFTLMFQQTVLADASFCRESLNKMVQALNLTADQKTKIKPIIDQMKSSMKDSASQMQGLEDQITQQVYSDNMDQSKVSDIVDQKSKLIGDMMKARISATNQIYAVLNPQQKTKLQTALKNADEKMANAFKKCEQD